MLLAGYYFISKEKYYRGLAPKAAYGGKGGTSPPWKIGGTSPGPIPGKLGDDRSLYIYLRKVSTFKGMVCKSLEITLMQSL